MPACLAASGVVNQARHSSPTYFAVANAPAGLPVPFESTTHGLLHTGGRGLLRGWKESPSKSLGRATHPLEGRWSPTEGRAGFLPTDPRRRPRLPADSAWLELSGWLLCRPPATTLGRHRAVACPCTRVAGPGRLPRITVLRRPGSSPPGTRTQVPAGSNLLTVPDRRLGQQPEGFKSQRRKEVLHPAQSVRMRDTCLRASAVPARPARLLLQHDPSSSGSQFDRSWLSRKTSSAVLIRTTHGKHTLSTRTLLSASATAQGGPARAGVER
jgi:hypothetical protein